MGDPQTALYSMASAIGVIVVGVLIVLAIFMPYMIWRLLVHVHAMRRDLARATKSLDRLASELEQSLRL